MPAAYREELYNRLFEGTEGVDDDVAKDIGIAEENSVEKSVSDSPM